MPKLSELINIGPKTAARLAEVGVGDLKTLKRLGAVAAYRRLKQAFPKETSLNALYALSAGLENRPWQSLSATEKEKLKAAVQDRSELG